MAEQTGSNFFDKKSFVQDYIVEACENLDFLDELCIRLSKNNRDENAVKELLRILHTLKGTSRMMEFPQIEKIIHETESVFKKLQSNQFEINKTYLTLLLNIISVVRKAVDSIEKNGSEDIVNFDFIIENVHKAFTGEEFSTDFEPEKSRRKPKRRKKRTASFTILKL